jgi:hypothetical protein
MNQEVEFYVKLRDTGQTLVDIAKQRIEFLTPPEVKEDTEPADSKETVFTDLSYDAEEGPKIGTFEAAYKANNPEDKWTQTYNILKNKKATIKDRYHNEGYQHSYWLYEGNKIYRQKLKAKPQK